MRNIRYKVILLNSILFLCASHVFSLDFSIRISPVASIPLGSDMEESFSIGLGGALNPEIELFNFVSVGPEFGYYYIPARNTGTAIQFLAGGAGLGAFYYPASRIKLNLGVSGGAYQSFWNGLAYGDLWWKAQMDVGFRFSPSFTLGLSGGYINFNRSGSQPMYTGINAGLSSHISFDTVKTSGKVDVSLSQDEPVFPLFYIVYKQNSIGSLKIVNNESAEIRNVTVSFRADTYTSSLMLCGSADLIAKHKSVEIPLYADFSETLLNFTENGKIPGEIIVNYELLGAKRVMRKTLVVSVYNRNNVRWTDTAVIASYISPNAPEVLDYSKYIVGISRDRLRTGLNRNMQFAMYLFEGLKVAGLSYSADTETPYTKYHKDPQLLDYIQYPFQTLAFHSGDYDDLGLLYAAALESVGIRSAIIPLDDDFIVAFSLGITAVDAENLFSGMDNLLTIADEIWIPLSFSVLREGFINSWYKAMNGLDAAITAEQELNFIVLQETWKTYPPASIKGTEARFEKPLEDSVVRSVEADLLRYISTEFGPKIKAVQETIQVQGATAQLYNQLGVLYVRAGLYPEAKAEYVKAAALKSVPAMVNLGNIAVLEKDFKTALQWFSKALELQPDNRSAQNGLERAKTELE